MRHRDWTAARRTGRPSGGARSRGRWRRAGVARRIADAAAGRAGGPSAGCAQPRECVHRSRLCRSPRQLQRKSHVLVGGLVRVQRVGLEHHRDAPFLGRLVGADFALDPDRAGSRSSSPAIMRRSVDLPQPEGPTKTMSSPSATSRSTPLMTLTAPKDFFTLSSCSVAIRWSCLPGRRARVGAHALAALLAAHALLEEVEVLLLRLDHALAIDAVDHVGVVQRDAGNGRRGEDRQLDAASRRASARCGRSVRAS